MRRLVIIAAAVVAVALWLGSAEAGEYHVGSSLVCSDCHTMHHSAQHSYTANTGNPWSPAITGGGGNLNLLTLATTNGLCLSCHGTGTNNAPDVLDANSSVTFTAYRQAGMLNTSGSTGNYADYKGHTLDSTLQAPGGTWSQAAPGFKCTNCHDPHGTAAQYRNLVSKPGGIGTAISITYAKTAVNTLDATKHVSIMNGGNNSYDYTKIAFGRPDMNYSAWCQGCHTNFHVTAGTEPWSLHPTGLTAIGATADAHSNATNWWAATSPAFITNGRPQTLLATNIAVYTDNYPSCMSCHRAHGSVNPFGLIYAYDGNGNSSLGGELKFEEGQTGTGTATVVALCNKCHKKSY